RACGANGTRTREVPPEPPRDHRLAANVGTDADRAADRRGRSAHACQPCLHGSAIHDERRPRDAWNHCPDGGRGWRRAAADWIGDHLMTLLLVLAAISFAASLTLLAETAMPAARRRRDAVAIVRRFVGSTRRVSTPRKPSAAMMAAEKIGSRLSTVKFRDGLSQRLAAAGYAGRVTPEAFLAFRAGMLTIGVLLGLCLSAVAHLGGRSVLICAIAGVGGFLAPGLVLQRKARARRARISAELPDALDLLAVTVEAGLGLYGAIERSSAWRLACSPPRSHPSCGR